MGRSKLHALTGLRFFAAAMIVFHHTLGLSTGQVTWANGIAWDHGVSLFFVLSGFILSYSYSKLATHEDVTRYLVARFARLWPVHAFCVLALFVAFPISSLTSHSRDLLWIVPLNLSMTHAWVPMKSIYFSLNTPSWSISVELFFYLLFPILIRNGHRFWFRRLALSFVLLVSLIVFGNWLAWPDYSASLRGVSTHGLMYINPAARLFEFILGMSGACFYERSRTVPWPGWLATILEIGLLGLCAYWVLVRPLSASLAPVVGPAGREWLQHSESCLAFALLIPVLGLGRGLVSKLLALAPFVLLGEMSYSIYLLHQPLVHFAERYPLRDLKLIGPGPYLLWIFILMAAFLTWRLIELPSRRWFLSRWDQRQGLGSNIRPVRKVA